MRFLGLGAPNEAQGAENGQKLSVRNPGSHLGRTREWHEALRLSTRCVRIREIDARPSPLKNSPPTPSYRRARPSLRPHHRLRSPSASPWEVTHGTLGRLEDFGGNLVCIRFRNRNFLPRRAFFFYPSQHQPSSLAVQPGCLIDEAEGWVCRDEAGRTSVAGLYAAGNANQEVQLVVAAAAKGRVTALTINNDLWEADASSTER